MKYIEEGLQMKVSLKQLRKDIITINNSMFNNFPINLNFRDDFEENPNETNIYGKYIESYIKNDSNYFFKIRNSSIFNIFREYMCKLKRYKNSPEDYRHYYSYGDVVSQIKEWIKLNNPQYPNESDNLYQYRLNKIMMDPKSITLRFFPKASFTGRLIRSYNESLPDGKKPKFFIINGLLTGSEISKFDYIGFFSCDSTLNKEADCFDKYLLNGKGNEKEWQKFLSFANDPKNTKYQKFNKNDFIRDISNLDAHKNNNIDPKSVKLQNKNINRYMRLIEKNPNKDKLFQSKNRDYYSNDKEFIDNYIKFCNANNNFTNVQKIISEEEKQLEKERLKKKAENQKSAELMKLAKKNRKEIRKKEKAYKALHKNKNHKANQINSRIITIKPVNASKNLSKIIKDINRYDRPVLISGDEENDSAVLISKSDYEKFKKSISINDN